MPSKIFSAATIGLESVIVEVEVDVLSAGLHNFTIVGLPDTAIKESRDRVSSALKNSGFRPPHQCGRITVNLAPADLPKLSPIYDLPMALGLLLTTKQIAFPSADKIFVGELALDGAVRPVHGVLLVTLLAKQQGITEVYVPRANAREASVVEGVTVLPVDSLHTLAQHLTKNDVIAPHPPTTLEHVAHSGAELLDMADVKGQEHAKRALEIAAAGGHNIIFNGPPGSGKTLLAKVLPSILPRLTLPESLEITKIFSVAGKLSRDAALVTVRPFRAPHHSASAVSLIGGGTYPRPGEISLAHRGVLFLDEFAEFPRSVLENLRQPLEDGIVTVSRAKGSSEFPAQFMLVAAMNPCPCGNATDVEKLCSCAPAQVVKYQRRVSGPILDRIDLHVDVPRMKIEKLEQEGSGESSASIRTRIEHARALQQKRFDVLSAPIFTNSEMNARHIKQFCVLDDASKTVLRSAVAQMQLSARAYHRLIKVARTIADLANAPAITSNHIAEAIHYRFKTE